MALYSWFHLETVNQRQELPDVGRLDRPPRRRHHQRLFGKTESDVASSMLTMSNTVFPRDDLQILDPPIPRVAAHPSQDFDRVPHWSHGTACGTMSKVRIVASLPVLSRRNCCYDEIVKMPGNPDCPTCRESSERGRCHDCDGSGVNVHVNAPDPKCPECGGTGICPVCQGSGLRYNSPVKILDLGLNRRD